MCSSDNSNVQHNGLSGCPEMEVLGWDGGWNKEFTPFLGLGFEPARVTCEYREAYDVIGASGELQAEISGRFRHEHPPAQGMACGRRLGGSCGAPSGGCGDHTRGPSETRLLFT